MPAASSREVSTIRRRLLPIAVRIPFGVSAHHVHLSQADCEQLFGVGHRLSVAHPISQPGQFAAMERVELVGPRASIAHVGIVGPVRAESQVELARTDAVHLGIQPPVRESGRLAGTPGLTLRGPAGEVTLKQGVIVAQRHIHMGPEEARRFRLENGERVRVRVAGARPVIFEDVVVRVRDDFALELHLDTDEANAAGVDANATAWLELDR